MTSTRHEARIYAPACDVYDEKVGLGVLIGVPIEGRWLICTITLVAIPLNIAHILIATLMYEADKLIQVEEKKSALGDFDINALFEADTSTTAENELSAERVLQAGVKFLGVSITDISFKSRCYGAAKHSYYYSYTGK